MLVATANWAIPDGTVAALPRAALYARLFDDIHSAAVRAGMRHGGRYRPIERLVVVLAGDTFDGLVSARWVDDVRPWERGRRATARHEEVLAVAARNARRPLAALARLARRGVVVPSADRRGRPVVTERVVVPVHLVVLAGDRDAALEGLCGQAWSQRRGIGIGSLWDGDGWCVVHGSACDPLAAGEGRPNLLQSIAIDLLARFGATLAARPGWAGFGRKIVRTLADGQLLDMPLRLGAALLAIAGHGVEAAGISAAWLRSVERWDREARRAGCDDTHGEVTAIAAWMHALGNEAALPPGARAVIAALSGSLPAAASRPAVDRLTILGHPASGGDSGQREVVCLGAPSMGPWRGSAAGGVAAGGASCIEATPVVSAGRLPAVAVPEADEGAGMPAAWWPMWDAGMSRGYRREMVQVLEAA